MSYFARLMAVLALLGITGCGVQGNQHGPVVSDAMLPVLATSAVPGIPSVTARLTTETLGKDAPIPALAATITSWGYLGGRQRSFQGESHYLTYVVSRALVFRDATGAQRYAAFLRENAASFFGGAVQTERLTGQGLSGWLYTPPLCACHLANPALIGVLDAGPRIMWLEINGPAATPALLVRLLNSLPAVAGLRLS